MTDFEDRFMDSEAELDAEIKGLAILTEHPQLFQGFAELGCAASLVGLLAHENTDISIAVVELISELTDDDVEVEVSFWNALVAAMVSEKGFSACRVSIMIVVLIPDTDRSTTARHVDTKSGSIQGDCRARSTRSIPHIKHL